MNKQWARKEGRRERGLGGVWKWAYCGRRDQRGRDCHGGVHRLLLLFNVWATEVLRRKKRGPESSVQSNLLPFNKIKNGNPDKFVYSAFRIFFSFFTKPKCANFSCSLFQSLCVNCKTIFEKVLNLNLLRGLRINYKPFHSPILKVCFCKCQ